MTKSKGKLQRAVRTNTAVIWLLLEVHPGATAPQLVQLCARVAPCVPMTRVPEILFACKAAQWVRRSDERDGRFSRWYTTAEPTGVRGVELPAELQDYLAKPRPLPATSPEQEKINHLRPPVHRAYSHYAEIRARNEAAGTGVVPPRQAVLDKPWQEPYRPGPAGARPGAFDFRAVPSRRGDQRVHCYSGSEGQQS